MNARSPFFALALCLTTLPGCATGNGAGSPTYGGPESNLLCISEIGATRFTTLLEAVHALRPRFLRGRKAGSEGPVAYVDGSRMNDLGILHAMSPREIVQVRYLPAVDATTLYGTGHDGGALLVSTHRGRATGCGR